MIRAAIVTPSSPGTTERVSAGLQALSSLGVEPLVGPLEAGPRHYLAGPDATRAQGLLAAFERPDADLVWALRGGFGAVRTLEAVDGERLITAARTRPFLGFSDCTVLLNWLAARGAPALHAPSVTQVPELTASAWRWLHETLRGVASHELPLAAPEVLRAGRAEGRLMGGNLATLAALVGTPWMPPLHDTVLVLEDVGEPAYRLDRMITQLRQAGALRGVLAVLLGTFSGAAAGERPSIEALWRELAAQTDGPVVSGLAIGHTAENHGVWLGRRVVLEAGDGVVARYTEPAPRIGP